MEMGFGLCTLAALMWLLWWNGFGEIHEDQLSLRYFREILSFLVLGQLTGVIGILREKWLARAIRNPRWVELGLGLVILVMLAGDFFHSTFISKIELQNIFRALCLCYGAAPLPVSYTHLAFPGMPKDGEKVFPNPLRQWGKGAIGSPHKLL